MSARERNKNIEFNNIQLSIRLYSPLRLIPVSYFMGLLCRQGLIL